jgi:hypothetical protein
MLKSLFIFILLVNSAQVDPDTTMTTIKDDSLKLANHNVIPDSPSDSTQVSDSTIVSIEQPDLIYPVVENNAFHIGEKLTFKVRYGFVRAGTATMSVVKEKVINDKPVYHIQTTAESDAPFSWVYEVKDVVNSYLDKDGLFSWRFEKMLREGGYEIDHFVDYFPEDSLAKVKNIRYRDEGNEESAYDVKVPPFAMDVLAAFYYIRTKPLRIGDIISMVNHDNKKTYDLEVHVYMRETVDTAAGEFKCLKIEPLLKGEGIFKQKGRLLVWVTDDAYKIPVQMTSEIAVGHITTELEKIEGIKGKIPSRISD